MCHGSWVNPKKNSKKENKNTIFFQDSNLILFQDSNLVQSESYCRVELVTDTLTRTTSTFH
jgi:hypothetical protein